MTKAYFDISKELFLDLLRMPDDTEVISVHSTIDGAGRLVIRAIVKHDDIDVKAIEGDVIPRITPVMVTKYYTVLESWDWKTGQHDGTTSGV